MITRSPLNLDNQLVSLEKSAGNISYEFNSENPKMVVEYQPVLAEGEHTLSILANNQLRNFGDTLVFRKRFLVSNETRILDVYNYPNPIIDNTYFTFVVTQVPDQVKIMVYTISGRLIKEIVKTFDPNEGPGFKKIFWDCRDEDGDMVGNGTYLYKVIMKEGDKTETSVHKLAIVR